MGLIVALMFAFDTLPIGLGYGHHHSVYPLSVYYCLMGLAKGSGPSRLSL